MKLAKFSALCALRSSALISGRSMRPDPPSEPLVKVVYIPVPVEGCRVASAV